MRSEIIPNASVVDPKAFEDKVATAREIAQIIRKNVVQARQVEAESEKWRMYLVFAMPSITIEKTFLTIRIGLRFTPYTELGTNDSVKSPPPMAESSRSAKKRAK